MEGQDGIGRLEGMEADLKTDKRGLALAVIRKRRLAVQKLVVLLIGVAHHLLLWAREWLVPKALRLRHGGIVRLVQEVWAVPRSSESVARLSQQMTP